MLAAVSALAYTVGNLLRVESYLAYILPLPIVIAALRSGPVAAFKTLLVAVLLLLSECEAAVHYAAAALVSGLGGSCVFNRHVLQRSPRLPALGAM